MKKKTQQRVKHIPYRTCIGCRLVNAKRTLVRIVRTADGVVVDPTGKIAGRGAYVHNSRSCWELALKGPVSRALRGELTEDDRTRLLEYLKTLPADAGTGRNELETHS
ncbi:MAG: YlxR family protein [Anaerolineaceae bacterium]